MDDHGSEMVHARQLDSLNGPCLGSLHGCALLSCNAIYFPSVIFIPSHLLLCLSVDLAFFWCGYHRDGPMSA